MAGNEIEIANDGREIKNRFVQNGKKRSPSSRLYRKIVLVNGKRTDKMKMLAGLGAVDI